MGTSYYDLLSLIQSSNSREVKTSKEARNALVNSKIRDTKATDLFSSVCDAYISKLKENKDLKKALFIFSLIILSLFVLAFIACVILICVIPQAKMENIFAILIPAAVSVTTSVISIILVIAKYLFPQKEDENFALLVAELRSTDKK